jgi:ribosomal protein S18 acetylase RimI-like enzyme
MIANMSASEVGDTICAPDTRADRDQPRPYRVSVFIAKLHSRAWVRDVVGDDPYALFALGAGTDPRGIRVELVATGIGVLWWSGGPLGLLGHGLGDPSVLDFALKHARAEGLLDGVGWVSLPRRTPAQVPAGWAHREDWDYRWLPNREAAVVAPKQDSVRPVSDADAIGALLDVAFPDSMLRPGHPMVNQWYGAYVDGALVACAADRSVHSPDPDAVPTGMIGAVAVHPEHRGQGWGAAVTAALASVLTQRYVQVGLGVSADNSVASRLYDRLGFTGVHRITSIRPA